MLYLHTLAAVCSGDGILHTAVSLRKHFLHKTQGQVLKLFFLMFLSFVPADFGKTINFDFLTNKLFIRYNQVSFGYFASC